MYIISLLCLLISVTYYFAYEPLLQCNLFTYPIPFNNLFLSIICFSYTSFLVLLLLVLLVLLVLVLLVLLLLFFEGEVGGGDAASRSWAVRIIFNTFFTKQRFNY